MLNSRQTIDIELYDAVLFDLDGVVTKTADVHATAWKKLFDEYLKKKAGTDDYDPFDIQDDYIKYVDGKPRYKGVKDFIASRSIDIAYGSVDDTPDKETVCGLGNRKNYFFSELLKKNGVKVYESTIDLIKQLRRNGFKTAIVSSSKNCLRVLRAADIEELFDVRVDGVLSERLGLAGKPEPDIFLLAAEKLNVEANRCVVVEDALSGVEAGKKGGFRMVIGVNRTDQAEHLKQKGADLVVNDLCKIKSGVLIKNLPHALKSFGKIMELIDSKEIVMFLDYDSIISYMTPLPEDTTFYKDISDTLTSLTDQCTVFIISQKEVGQVKKQINIDSIYYADSAGNEINGPDGFLIRNKDHRAARDHNKGKTIVWLLEQLNLVSQSIFPVYLGGSLENEEAFEVVGQNGIGIVIGDDLHSSEASFKLGSPKQIRRFLLKLSPDLEKETSWNNMYLGFDPKDEGRRETMCALGNGYFVTRGAVPEAKADDIHYPGTYLAGGYNRLKTKISGRTIENEDLINLPNWLCLNFRIHGEKWFQLKDVTILFYRQYLHIKKGVLHRTIRFRDKRNRETIILQHTFVHGEKMHRAALKTTITPLNWEGKIEICSAIDGRVTNQGVHRYRDLKNQHLDLVDSKQIDEQNMVLKMRTKQSCIDIAMGARNVITINDKISKVKSVIADKPGGYVARHFIVNIKKGESLTIEKLICIYTSRDTGISECLLEAENTVTKEVESFDNLLKSHVTAWKLLWRKFDVKLELGKNNIERYTQKIIRLYIFHLLQSTSVHSLDIDVGMPARGWHGEGYRGHIFWDEMIIFPFLNYRVPQITKTLLMYRYRRLQEARRAASESGFEGAMYPWQSGSSGREETQQMHLNPASGRWIPDDTHLQRHVNNAIVYNIWQYFQITHDMEFLSFYGGEIIIEIARFWASIATYNKKIDRYEILSVMGPDEYHDSYPNADKPGLNNNTYTNLMVMFVMDQALNIQHVLPEQDWDYLRKMLEIEDKELALWKKISRRMKIVFHEDGVLSQFEGYEDLKEFDWDGYKKKYGNIQRLDRILEKEGDSANNYKLSKQADVLMLFYLFSAETLKKMFKRLDYNVDKNFITKTINYYLKRTTNGSSLALVIHAWIEARRARERSWQFFSRALKTDMVDDQTGSTREGIHLAAMSGCIDILQRGYAGLEIRSDILILNPLLPKSINRICFHIRYRKHWLDLEITQKCVKIKSLTSRARPIMVMVKDEIIRLHPGKIAFIDI
jgi:alpha,alpha-trehalase